MGNDPSLADIPGEKRTGNPFGVLHTTEILIEYDFPLLVVATDAEGKKWLFKWCNHLEDSDKDRWVAFPVSDFWLDALKSSQTSLREVMSLSSEEMFVFDASRMLKPEEIRSTRYDSLPVDYVPSGDISLDGITITTPLVSAGELGLRLHVLSERYFSEGKVPVSLISRIQARFQEFMSFAAHTIAGQRDYSGYSPDDWSMFNFKSAQMGSYTIECVSNSNSTQSQSLVKACEVFSELAKAEFDFDSMKERIGVDALRYAKSLAEFVSMFELSISIKWSTEKGRDGYLAIDKPRADRLLKVMEDHEKTVSGSTRTVTLQLFEGQVEPVKTFKIRLTDGEAEPLRRPVNGIGGMQSLLRGLQDKLGKDNEIILTKLDIQRILRYGDNYGQGGFQGRLAPLARAIKRIGITFGDL